MSNAPRPRRPRPRRGARGTLVHTRAREHAHWPTDGCGGRKRDDTNNTTPVVWVTPADTRHIIPRNGSTKQKYDTVLRGARPYARPARPLACAVSPRPPSAVFLGTPVARSPPDLSSHGRMPPPRSRHCPHFESELRHPPQLRHPPVMGCLITSGIRACRSLIRPLRRQSMPSLCCHTRAYHRQAGDDRMQYATRPLHGHQPALR